jgi:outer membrane protein assembly factor BamB
VALDKATGKEVWSTPRDQGRGFSTPVLMKTATGRTDLLLNGPVGLWGYDPATGKERWRVTRSDPKDQHQFGEPLPVTDGQHLFVLSGRTGPWQVVKMPNEGDVTKTHVLHTATRGKRDVCSPIVVDGRAYCVDKGAQLTVFDIKNGKKTATLDLKRGANAMASPVLVRGKLLWTLGEGTTVVVEPGETPRIVGRNKLPGESLDYGASPAIVDGRLYIRSRQTLWCIGEKK